MVKYTCEDPQISNTQVSELTGPISGAHKRCECSIVKSVKPVCVACQFLLQYIFLTAKLALEMCFSRLFNDYFIHSKMYFSELLNLL